MTIEEQATAEAEREYPAVPIAFRGLTYPADAMHQARVGAYVRGYLAGHEAATRTREVSTVAELDALPVGSVVLDKDSDAWQKTVAGWFACNLGAGWMSTKFLPARVLYVPEEGR